MSLAEGDPQKEEINGEPEILQLDEFFTGLDGKLHRGAEIVIYKGDERATGFLEWDTEIVYPANTPNTDEKN